jgi:anti-sigma-K factor RskA
MDRHRMTHEEAALELPALVIGALDDDEAEAVATHVAGCDLCREEQILLEQTLGLMGTAVPPIEPPPDLRARLLGRLDMPADPTPILDDIEPARPPVSLLHRLTSFGLAAAAVLLIGLLVWAMLLRHDLNQTQQNLNLAAQQHEDDTELLANASRAITMVADGSPNSYGTLYIGAQTNHALMVVEDLPPTPADQMYQVWLVSGSDRISAGLFTVNESGSATVLISAPDTLTSYQSLGITAEPAPDGSPSPTGERVIGCSLQ